MFCGVAVLSNRAANPNGLCCSLQGLCCQGADADDLPLDITVHLPRSLGQVDRGTCGTGRTEWHTQARQTIFATSIRELLSINPSAVRCCPTKVIYLQEYEAKDVHKSAGLEWVWSVVSESHVQLLTRR